MNARADHIHTARVLIAEARSRRLMGVPGFAAMLLGWAANARRRADHARPPQMELNLR